MVWVALAPGVKVNTGVESPRVASAWIRATFWVRSGAAELVGLARSTRLAANRITRPVGKPTHRVVNAR